MAKPKPKPGRKTAYLTVDDFAEALSVSPSTVRNAINRGEVKIIRFARAVRIPITEFDRLGLNRPDFLNRGEAA